MIRLKQDQNTTRKPNPRAPCLASGTHDRIVWSPKGLSTSAPPALLSVAHIAFGGFAVPPCLQFFSADILQPWHLQHPGVFTAAFASPQSFMQETLDFPFENLILLHIALPWCPIEYLFSFTENRFLHNIFLLWFPSPYSAQSFLPPPIQFHILSLSPYKTNF